MNIGLVIPTLNAGASFELLLKKIEQQNEKIVEKIIIDSGSTDDTVKIGKKYNYRIIEIKEFNHGNSRRIAVENLFKSDVVVFITQDIEIYNEEIRDLLNLKTPSKHIILRDSPVNTNSVIISGVIEAIVTEPDDALKYYFII